MIIIIFSDKPQAKLHFDTISSVFDDSIEDEDSKRLTSHNKLNEKKDKRTEKEK